MNGDELNRQKQRHDAKALYLEGLSISAISKRTLVPEGTLRRWIYHGSAAEAPWNTSFKVSVEKMLERELENRSREISGIWEASLTLIRESIEARAKERDRDGKPVPLSIKELRELTDAITNLEKLRRLESGKSTENIQAMAPLTVDDVVTALTSDEFLGLIPLKPGVDFREIKHGSEPAARSAIVVDEAALGSNGATLGVTGEDRRAEPSDLRTEASDPGLQGTSETSGCEDPLAE